MNLTDHDRISHNDIYNPVDMVADEKFSFQTPGEDGGLPNEANMKVSILSSVNY